ISSVAWSPDGRRLACGGYDEVVFWDEATGKKSVFQVPPPLDSAAVVFSPDGRILAGTDGFHVRLWDPREDRELLTFDTVGTDHPAAAGVIAVPRGRLR